MSGDTPTKSLYENIINSIHYSDEYCLIAEKPWTRESRSEWIIAEEDVRIDKDGMVYFLEKHVMEEVDEVTRQYISNPSQDQIFECILFYATNDAYHPMLMDEPDEPEKIFDFNIRRQDIILTETPDFDKGLPIPQSLKEVLKTANGFFCLDDALHFYPYSGHEVSIVSVNAPGGWKDCIPEFTQGLTFFAQDVFGCQYGFGEDDAIYKYDTDDGTREKKADNLDDFLLLASSHPEETGLDVLRQWNAEKGPLERGMRLVGKIMFCFTPTIQGLDGLAPCPTMSLLQERIEILAMIKDLPPGSQIRFVVVD